MGVWRAGARARKRVLVLKSSLNFQNSGFHLYLTTKFTSWLLKLRLTQQNDHISCFFFSFRIGINWKEYSQISEIVNWSSDFGRGRFLAPPTFRPRTAWLTAGRAYLRIMFMNLLVPGNQNNFVLVYMDKTAFCLLNASFLVWILEWQAWRLVPVQLR